MISAPNLLARLVEEYELAENHIKRCERYTLSLPTAAVNQLRYAGSHLLKLIKGIVNGDGDDAVLQECTVKAANHCKRASFDALETQIYFQLEFISDFQNLCRDRRRVETVYPDYGADFKELVALQERLQAFGMVQQLSDKDRAELDGIAGRVAQMKRKILRIKVEVEQLEKARPDMETIIAARQFLVSFAATVLGTLVGVAGVVVAIFDRLPDSWWSKATILGGILVVLVIGWVIIYCFSASKLLTEDQRRALL